MSDTILGGRWVIYYEAEGRQKRVKRDTSVSPTSTDSVNALYSALQDLFDELNQMDDGTPMSAQTPTEYTIGIIDSGDDDPWFIDRESVEYLTGGAIKTASWTRVSATNTGIVRVPYSVGAGTDFVPTDIGKTVNHTAGDSGTLLDYQTDGSTGVAWIRPTDSTAGNDWDSASGSITVSGGSGDVTQTAAASSGESLWANIYSIGTIEDKTHLYVIQNGVKLSGYKSTTDWWGDNHVDVLINVKEVGQEIDDGVVTVFARHYSKSYDHYEVDLTSGGRNPIPLATADDLDNTTGHRTMSIAGASGNYTVGEEIQGGTSGARGIVTAETGDPTLSLNYYLIGDLTDFQTSEIVTGQSSGVTGTSGAPADAGPATYTDITITHAADDTFDIDENGTTEPYSIVIDCAGRALTQVYERIKYLTRRGETSTGSTDGQDGEQYRGSRLQIEYNTQTGNFTEGLVVTGATSGAKGVIVADHDDGATGDLILRNVRGVFQNGETITDTGTGSATISSTRTIVAVKASPFGTFAGGKFFCAPGVVLQNYQAGDANNFQLKDDNGNVITAPNKVAVTVTNTRQGDRVAVFRLDIAGGSIKKDTYTIDVAQGGPGATSLKVDPAINAEEPGKSTGGIVRVVDVSAGVERRYRYTSWSGDTYTLFNITGLTADAAGGSSTVLKDTGAQFVTNGVKIGDIIRNITDVEVAYVTQVVDENTLNTTALTGDWNSDSYEIGTTVDTYTTSDTAYVPFIDLAEDVGTDGSPGQADTTVTYAVDIPVRVRVRQAGLILPFVTDSTIKSTGMSVATIRTADNIYT